MDNLTHSLFGAAVAKTFRWDQKKALQKAALLTAVIGNNLPDLDFLIGLKADGGLSYLIHHRGYTHTVVAMIPLGVLSAALGVAFAGGWKKFTRQDLLKLSFLGIFSILTHILLDWRNNYGVHPFSPFVNYWYHGDSIFIIEPLFWGCLLPFLFFRSETIARAFALGFGVFSLGLMASGWIATAWAIAGAALFTVLVTILQKLPKAQVTTWIAFLSIHAVFYWGSVSAKSQVRSELLTHHPDSTIAEIAVNPTPSNPLCWRFASVSIENRTDYVARIGALHLLTPMKKSPHSCDPFPRASKSLSSVKPKHALLLPGGKTIDESEGWNQPGLQKVEWYSEYRRDLSDLSQVMKNHCRFEQLLRFSRIPYWWTEKDQLFATDLRYDPMGDRKSFARMNLNQDFLCDDLPFWNYPLEEVVKESLVKKKNQ